MPDLIQPTQFSFPQIQRESAEAAVLARRLSGEITNAEEARFILRSLLDKISVIQGALVLHPEFRSFQVLSSDGWNTFVEGVIIDLRTIYDALSSLDGVVKQMEAITLSDLTQTKSSITKAINQLRVYQFLKSNPEYQDLKLIDFTRNINESSRRPNAVIDSDIRMLELPVRSSTIMTTQKAQDRKATVSVKYYGGGTKAGLGDDFEPVNALDPNQKNFWVEILSTKNPVSLVHNASWGDYTANGIVAEITIRFSKVNLANNFKLLPFAEFPYNVIDMAYKESESDVLWKTLPDFSIREAIEDWIEFDFPLTSISDLRITIEQPNYIRSISVVPTNLIYKNHVWAQLKAEEYSRDVHDIELTTAQRSLIDVEPEQLTKLIALDSIDKELGTRYYQGTRVSQLEDHSKYLDAIGTVADRLAPNVSNEIREVSYVTSPTVSPETIQLISYDYLFGIRACQLEFVLYSTHAYYESGEFVTNGTVIEVQLDTDEVHPVLEETDGVISYRPTSIEYEVEVSPDTRYPILPISSLEGTNYVVRDEWVKLTNGKGRLRFTPNAGSLMVRENSKRISMTSVTIDGRDITISPSKSNAIYTATYTVTEAATKVLVDNVLDSTELLSPEEFLGTDPDNKITLKSYPYIIYEIVRDEAYWSKRENDAVWEWTPDFIPLSDGTVALTNSSTSIDLTKASGSDPDFDSISFIEANDLKIWVQETGEILDIDVNPPVSITGTKCFLSEIYTGTTFTSSRFILGRTKSYDNKTFGLNIDTYEPIKIFVDGVKALNKTDYISGQHPVLNSLNDGEPQYEFIQAGKNIYFNGPINGKITVQYSWLTQYLKLVATLRCNVPVLTVFTPKLDTARLRVKTTEL